MTIPSQEVQEHRFSELRAINDRELRNTGFEDFLINRDEDPSMGLLIVAREIEYSSQAATRDIDRDPLAVRIGGQLMVGCYVERPGSWNFTGHIVSHGLVGERQEHRDGVDDVTYLQLAVVEACVHRLTSAKHALEIPFLTKSLKKIDLAGD